MNRKKATSAKTLFTTTQIPVRFSEVDSLKVVWHGHYYKYFEDGREAFGHEHGIDYLTVFEQGFVIPIVKSSCEHKNPLEYGDEAIIETTYVDTRAAKIQFTYKIFRASDKKLAATGATTQVFLDRDGQLVLNTPESVEAWKKKWKLI